DVTATAPLRGLQVAEAGNGRGIAVTKVTANGIPVLYDTPPLAPGAPAPASATLANNNTQIVITFDKPLDATSIPPAADFLAVSNSVGKAPLTVAISGSAVTLTFDASYSGLTSVTIGYTPSSPVLKGQNGTAVAAFSSYSVSLPVTWNPADMGAGIVLSANNLAATGGGTARCVRATKG